MSKIFVSIASYRDPELKKTLKDLLKKSKNPKNLRIAIAWQHSQDDDWDELEDYKKDSRFSILDIDYKNAQGVCWARSEIQKLYQNEEYYLQLDSHHRFEKNWDSILKDYINFLKCKGYNKPILSSYLPSYDPSTEKKLEEVWGLNIDRFLPEGAVFLRPHNIDNWKELKEPFSTRFLSAHFIFTIGQFAKEVLYDPELYFHGEETSLAARAYTQGYDLFSPHRPLVHHEYTREGKKKHWDDSSDWSERDRNSYKRFRILFGMEEGCSSCQRNRTMGIYSFGNIRTLQDYEKYAGLKFETRQIHSYTRSNQFPPTQGDYESGLMNVQKHCINVYKGSLKETDYQFFAVAFLDSEGKDLYRKDADEAEIKTLLNTSSTDQFIHIWREFEGTTLPHSSRVWPYSKSKGWCDVIDDVIKYE